jgi:hydroxymethylpyrimidine/phosphomethylpyrimidine kinase
MIPNILSIAGTDPTGGAGIQADLKTFSALGAYGMSVITAVVSQNTQGVRSFVALDPEFVGDQIEAVFDDVRVDAVKIGMVANAAIADSIATRLERYADCPIVLDPVMVATSGHRLLSSDAVSIVRERLIPLSTLVTPNLLEAGDLLNSPHPTSLEEMRTALEALHQLGSGWVLLKGGHLDGQKSIDLLQGNGKTCTVAAPRVLTRNSHGTGCTLSAAITAFLPSMDVLSAVLKAKNYLTHALASADRLQIGTGNGPVHHFHAIWK